MRKLAILLAFVILLTPVVFACEPEPCTCEDGVDGADGQDGATGPAGEDLTSENYQHTFWVDFIKTIKETEKTSFRIQESVGYNANTNEWRGETRLQFGF